MTLSEDNVRFYGNLGIPDRLMREGERASFEKGAVIIGEDEPFEFAYCVLSGTVCGLISEPNGDKVIMAIIEAGGAFGESDIFLGYSRISAGFVAESDVELLAIPRQSLIDYMNDHEIALYFARNLSRKFLSTARMYVDAVEGSALRRVCGAFLDFDLRYGVDRDGIRVIEAKIGQQYVADYLGVSRLTVNKCPRRLREAKLIRKLDDAYWIPDKKALTSAMKLME
ncbi:Crp/Fnr family transcriptional regulator [Raoultibacter massiliensis]|uniref:Crp/Fnr family transcriptional regulator n=1 Tax=Raoultibacter massiliensis TaxID=1852371 RepID=A0ABV1JC58_9ACTN